MVKTKTAILCLLCISIVVLPRCHRQHEPAIEKNDLALSPTSGEDSDNARLIFYNMYLPPKMSDIFQKVGAKYNPELLNEPENFASYQEPDKIALNLGIFGVDLNYTRMFNQPALTSRYLANIRHMTEKLDIPSSYFDSLLSGMERFYDNKDSVTRIVTSIYDRSDSFLKANDHDALAALIVTGGWIEALYISTRIWQSDPENIEISDRIAEQKYSLNSLISLLNNYHDDIAVAGNILMLKLLKKTYDNFEIHYDENDFKIDTVNKMISTSNYRNEITPEILSEICYLVSEIRVQMIN